MINKKDKRAQVIRRNGGRGSGGEDKIREGYNVLSKLVMIMALETRMDGNTSFVATPWGGGQKGGGRRVLRKER